MHRFKPVRAAIELAEEQDAAHLGVGEVELTAGNATMRSTARVELGLLPKPALCLHAEFKDVRSTQAVRTCLSAPQSVSIRDVTGRTIEGAGGIERWGSDHTMRFKWWIVPEPLEAVGDDTTEMTTLIGTIFNLRSGLWQRTAGKYGAVDLSHKRWQVTIKLVKLGMKRVRELNEKGGHRMTHTVEITLGGNCFNGEEAKAIIRAVRSFLSFASGGVCAVVCPTGLDQAGKIVWAQWCSPEVVPGGTALSWWDPDYGETLIELFPQFMERWSAQKEADTLEAAIQKYGQANANVPTSDTGVAIVQIAMERIAYIHGKKKGNAAEKYRWLLKWLKIPTDIPEGAKALANKPGGGEWEDGPHALTCIRNEMSHGEKRLEELSDAHHVEAWLVATRYLELTVLALCGFEGEYRNRMTGAREQVPWAQTQ